MGVDAISAVENCLKLVDDESQITLDIILLDKISPAEGEEDDGKTFANFMRNRDITGYYKSYENVLVTMMAYPNVNYRYIMEPTGWYPTSVNQLNFGPEVTEPMQANGKADAKASLDADEGASFKPYWDWINSRAEHGKSIKDFVETYKM